MPDFAALWDFNDPKSSEDRFRAAASELAWDSPDRFELETQIARAQGLQRRFEEAHLTLDKVASAIESGNVNERVRLLYLLERGRVFRSNGDPARARPFFLEAFERAHGSHQDNLAVDAAHMVALVEPPDAQMVWNQRALAMSHASSDPVARRWRASLLNNMAWTLHGRGDFPSALDHFERALEARLEEGDTEKIRIARWCVARCLRSLGRVEEALAIQRELARELEARNTSDGFVDEELGECLLASGRGEEATGHFARAAEVLGKDPALQASEPHRLERLRSLSGPSRTG